MKNFQYILMIFVLFMMSCEKELDVKSKSSFSDDVIFSDPSLADGALMGAYNIIGNTSSYITRLWVYTGINTDIEVRPGVESGNTNLIKTSTNSLDLISLYNTDSNLEGNWNRSSGDCWSDVYSGIERVNLCISGIRTYGDLTDPAMAHILGEALSLRAMFYSHLIQWWGDVPARFEPITSETLYLSKSNRDIIYDQIIVDLGEAIPMMNPAGSGFSNTTKRISQEAARGLRARIALTAAGYSMRPIDGGGSEIKRTVSPKRERELYEIARSECRAIIDEGIYSLDESFENIFHEQCQDVATHGREVILQLPYHYRTRGRFLSVYGLSRDAEGTSTTAQHNSVRVSSYFNISPNWFYDFNKNDTRRDVSIKPYQVRKGFDGIMEQQLVHINSLKIAKYRAEWYNGVVASSSDGVSPIVLRYADVLLMYAEADLFLGSTDGAEYFNQVRRRAFGVDISSLSIYDLPLTLDNIMKERGFEFIGENIRKYDLIRWGLLKTKMDETKQDLRDLREGVGKYADVPANVYYRSKLIDEPEGDRGLEIYGLNRGETQDMTIVDPAGGWSRRVWRNYTSSSNGANDLSDFWIDNIYHGNPDERQLLPIMNVVIVNSQGALQNDYGYNN